MEKPKEETKSAAEIVLDGKVTEDTAADLLREREMRTSLEKTVKDRELRIATLEDENGRLKSSLPTSRKGFLEKMAEFFPKQD